MNLPLELHIPGRIWVEMAEGDSCDVIVEMENGTLYTAMFVTLPYLARQMELGYEVSKTLPDVPAVAYATLETPHIIVPNLERDTIEDTIDNLIALDTFESLFTQVTDEAEAGSLAAPTPEAPRVGLRATAEMAAVVLTEVLVVR